jgi:N-acyl amino acid synthase of PEP-CTERM/exosortase system
MVISYDIREAATSISRHFDKFFVPEIAITPQQREEVYRIRYQVYCLDLSYEPIEKFPNHMEIDNYDDSAIHCLIKYKPRNIYVGCVRIILPNLKIPHLLFPIEKVCADTMNLTLSSITRMQFCEVSRLAIIPKFRRRQSDALTPSGIVIDPKRDTISNDFFFQKEERRKYPFMLPISLYLAACSMVSICGDLQALTLMEPRLMRHLQMSGFPSYQLGKVVDFHGARAPFKIYYKEVIENLSPDNRELFENIHTLIEQSTKYRLKTLIEQFIVS